MTVSPYSPEDFGKVAVLLGGRSAEREISLKSGNAVLASLQRSGVNAHAVDTAEHDAIERLQQEGFERVFNMLHGRGGEDGVMQGTLEMLGLPYTGSGVLGSAIAMDKVRTKQLWLAMGLSTPDFRVAHSDDDLSAVEKMSFPLMAKPAHEGSSIGMSKVNAADEVRDAWNKAYGFDGDVLFEQWITGPEYTVAIVQDHALPLIKLETPREFYDFEAKYQSDDTSYICPCGLPEEEEGVLQALALQAFAAVDASGWGRVDMMMDEAGQPYLIEVNTIPGMTDHSLVPMAARAAGIEFDQLVLMILATSFKQTAGEVTH